MEYGSAFGHGAYLGPDYTTDYLRRSSNLVQQAYGGPRSDAAVRQTVQDFRTNRYDEGTGTLTLTAAQASSFPPARALLQPLLLRDHDPARPAP
jgi:nitric oxide reductase subunit B